MDLVELHGKVQAFYLDLHKLASDDPHGEASFRLRRLFNQLLEETKRLCPNDELVGKLEPLPEAEVGFGVAVTHADLYVLTGQLKEAIRKKAGLWGTLFTVP